jgi:hypothetical protein
MSTFGRSLNLIQLRKLWILTALLLRVPDLHTIPAHLAPSRHQTSSLSNMYVDSRRASRNLQGSCSFAALDPLSSAPLFLADSSCASKVAQAVAPVRPAQEQSLAICMPSRRQAHSCDVPKCPRFWSVSYKPNVVRDLNVEYKLQYA